MSEAIDADTYKAYEIVPDKIQKYDLIGFGSGIYFFRHHKNLLKFVDDLPKANKKAFIFSTYGGGSPKFYHEALRKRLMARKFKILGEFSCKGFDTFGPLKLIGGINKGKPDENDLENARKFALKLMK